MNIEKIREDFPVTKEYVYLNNAATSPMPRPVIEAMGRYSYTRKSGMLNFSEWSQVEEETRKLLAKILHAKKEEIALVGSTSEGVNIAASLVPRGKVILNDLEFPSNFYPWTRHAYHVLKAKNGRIDVEEFENAIDKNTIGIALSHVSYKNGFTFDIEEIGKVCKEHGIYFFVDAIQSIGVLDVDVKKAGIDFLAAGAYKWQLGPSGIGVFYIREDLIEKFEPPYIGWKSAKEPLVFSLDYVPAQDARKFEIGTPSYSSIYGYRAALRYILSIGIKKIQKRVLKLTQILHDRLKRKITPENSSGIVSFVFDRNLPKKFVVTKKDYIRVSPHFFNTEDEIEDFLRNVGC